MTSKQACPLVNTGWHTHGDGTRLFVASTVPWVNRLPKPCERELWQTEAAAARSAAIAAEVTDSVPHMSPNPNPRGRLVLCFDPRFDTWYLIDRRELTPEATP